MTEIKYNLCLIFAFALLVLFIVNIFMMITRFIKRIGSKPYKKNSLPFLITTGISFILLIVFTYNWQYNLNFLPRTDFHTQYPSPTKAYTVTLYYESNGLADDTVLGILRDNSQKKERAIYYAMKKTPQVKWTAKDKVLIGSHKFDVRKHNQIYDYRHDKD
ncbi:DUF5412 family protein [Sporolactobacillus kofuensis]|uniref:DUF5412 family protein n=1 Tax=Sporolactobacillus kofuensis TaxID=269672 RepID=A0ABW1WDT4_9BACL|nr:DUF5412 family protein [Sporolactobacillus kofuensis]MCO7176133.1 DUF5412 domain-containing protein [Sporolactobacillus kofuensis]